MKVLVLGGTRYFGKRLTQLLLETGHDVTLLTRGQSPDSFGKSVNRIHADRKQIRADLPELQGKTWDIIYDQVCYDAGEAITACKAFQDKTARYIFTSSQSVYDEGADIPESRFDPMKHDFEIPADRNQNYAEAKRQAESVFFRNAHFPVVAVRFPIVLAPDDYTRRLHFHMERIQKNQPIHFINIQGRISFIHAADAARFLLFAGTKTFDGPVNVASPQPIQLRRMLDILETSCGKQAKLSPTKGEANSSPFGIDSDWFMNVDHAKHLGFEAEAVESWLPKLAQEIL